MARTLRGGGIQPNFVPLSEPQITVIIPVVFHVLWNSPEQKVSEELIQSQLAVLNEDFRRQNADRINTPAEFQSVAADVNIEFQLACITPSNVQIANDITYKMGIVYRNTPLSKFIPLDFGMKFYDTNGLGSWNPNKYLNVWVCNLDMPVTGYNGFATFPSYLASSPNTDGVVIDYRVFGKRDLTSPYGQGRTLTHEVGHWLNLEHIWGAATSNHTCADDDYVEDTPVQHGPTFGCPNTELYSCYGGGNSGDMHMNYMDYTDDKCKNLFTQGQKMRMRALFAPGGVRSGFMGLQIKGDTFVSTDPANPTKYYVDAQAENNYTGGSSGSGSPSPVAYQWNITPISPTMPACISLLSPTNAPQVEALANNSDWCEAYVQVSSNGFCSRRKVYSAQTVEYAEQPRFYSGAGSAYDRYENGELCAGSYKTSRIDFGGLENDPNFLNNL